MENGKSLGPVARSALSAVTRRRVLGAAGVAVGLPALAACGAPWGQSGAGAAAKKPVTLSAYMNLPVDRVARFPTEMAEPYTAANPHVKIELVPYGQGSTAAAVEKLQVLISGGDSPHIWDGPGISMALLEPIDAMVKRDKVDLKRFNQKHVEAGAIKEGKMWLFPKAYTGNALCFALNVDMFREAGVPLPSADSKSSWSWQQFMDALVKLTRTGSSGDVSQFGIQAFGSTTYTPPLLWEADWVTADYKTVTCDSPAMVDCYTSFFDMPFKYHVMPRLGEAMQLFGTATPFLAGKAAVTVVPPFSIPQFTQTKNVEIALAPLPRVKRTTPDLGLEYLGIPKGASNLEEAWQYLKWLNDGSRYAKFVGKVPAEVAQAEIWIRDQFKIYADARASVVASAIENAGSGIKLGSHPKLTQLSNVILPAMNTDIWQQQLGTADFLRALKPRLQDIVDGRA